MSARADKALEITDELAQARVETGAKSRYAAIPGCGIRLLRAAAGNVRPVPDSNRGSAGNVRATTDLDGRTAPMFPTFSRSRVRGFGLALAASALMLASPHTQAQSSPFAGLTGAWTGGGSIAMTDGSKERIRCKASYSVPPSGEALHLQLDCASDSYKVQVISNVVAGGDGNLSGTWREVTRQASGNVSGQVSEGGQISASLGGTGFSARLSVATHGNRQTVNITSEGTDVQSVTIEMRRA